jgi:hypothetical protein
LAGLSSFSLLQQLRESLFFSLGHIRTGDLSAWNESPPGSRLNFPRKEHLPRVTAGANYVFVFMRMVTQRASG